MDFIHYIEKVLGKKCKIIFKSMQLGDVESTYANVESLFKYIDFKPSTPIKVGVKAFVNQYLETLK